MIMLEINNLKKYYGDRLILNIKDFKAYYGERIGVVGANGAGKTTFLDIIAGRSIPEEGVVKHYGEISYITQLEVEGTAEIDSRMAKEFSLEFNSLDTASGGEKTRFKIASCLSGNSSILLADEPTSNLDIQGVELLEEKLSDYKGLLLMVSHDRKLISSIADRIVFIEGHKPNTFDGSYPEYNEFKKRAADSTDFDRQKQKLLLDTRLSEVPSRLSMPEKDDDIELLDMEYKKLLAEIKQLKEIR